MAMPVVRLRRPPWGRRWRSTHPHLPVGAGIAVRGVGSALLMGSQYMMYFIILIMIQPVIEIQDGPAG